MYTHRFGRKLKLPSTIAIKHQIRKLMFDDLVKRAEAGTRAEGSDGQLREETRPPVQSVFARQPSTDPIVNGAAG
jgi:hypothetical protein